MIGFRSAWQGRLGARKNVGPFWAIRVLPVVLGVFGAWSCSGGEGAGGGEGPAGIPRPGRIILLSMDTVRADRVSGYAATDTMPTLAEIASEGALFERFYAASTYTIPSHMAIMTGLDPAEHGVLVEGARLSPEVPTLAELLSEAGYRSTAFTEGVYVGARWGFDRGFDKYLELPRMAVVRDQVQAVTSWMREQGDEPYFLFLHSYAAHFPYGGFARYRDEAPERGLPEDQELKSLYAQVKSDGLDSLPKELQDLCLLINHFVPRHRDMMDVEDNRLPPDFPESEYFEEDRAALLRSYDDRLRVVDDALRRIRRTLQRQGQWDDTLLIVLSDHGEGFYEHGHARHDYVPFDEVLKVPFVISYPRLFRELGETGGGRRPRELAWHLDVLPTVLALAGIEPPDSYAGIDLTPMLLGEEGLEPRTLHPVVARAPNRTPQRALKRIVLDGSDKYIEGHETFGDTEGLLFDLALDPLEERNLREVRDADLERLREASERYVESLRWREPVHQTTGRPLSESAGDGVDLSPAQLEELRAMGYLGSDEDEEGE